MYNFIGVLYDKIRNWKAYFKNFSEEDLNDFFEACKEEEIGFWCGFKKHENLKESEEILKIFIKKPYLFGIFLKSENNKLIGTVELKCGKDADLIYDDSETEIGYWVNKKYWGHGYVTEAAKEAIRFAFEVLNKTAVWAGYYEGNERSKRVQEKLGFINNGKCDKVYVKRLDEYRVGYDNLLTYERWKEINKND